MFSSIKVDIEPLTESEPNVVAWFKRYELRFRYQLQHLKREEGKGKGKSQEGTEEDPRLELLPLFMSQPVLAAFEGLREDERSSYESVKQALINRYGVKPRQAYENFIGAKIQSGMTVDAFTDMLRQSIVTAVSGLSVEQVEELVLHQFLLAIPIDKKEQLLLATEKEGLKLRLADVLEKARSISLVRPVIPAPAPAVSAAIKVSNQSDDPKQKQKRRCYNCNEWGHMANQCPKPPKKTKNLGRGAQGSH
jgi:hypothetical protein